MSVKQLPVGRPFDGLLSKGVRLSQKELKDAKLDPGIAHAVHIMRVGGFETCQSCQGGKGHSYEWPTVDFLGDRTVGFRALAWAHEHNLDVHAISRVYRIWDGDIADPPIWRMEFCTRPRGVRLGGKS